ncbi:hypothetical protein [Saccharomonospora sp.]|uniref:hypothetical protein n=1 Tax=Saccharomonospora sp. TaxID=33913 RepID=UPI00260F8432|nr:hypothetical protein [Saccharomonospora sp.]
MNCRADLRTFLRSLDTETLADLLCEQADRDPELRRRLVARAAMADGAAESDGTSAETDKETTERADSTQADIVQLESVLDTVQRLLDAGTSADVAPLARRTVDRIVAAANKGDDLPPELADQLGRAVSLYARACVAHPPPARELAEWLTRLAFECPGWPEAFLADFADALGDEGLAHVREAVEVTLADTGADGGKRADTARALRLELAEITGDVDTVVNLLAEQLPRLDVSLRIVRVLRAAGRHAEAIAHAAKALGNTPGGQGDSRGSVIEALERVRTQQPPVDTSDVERLLRQDRWDEAWKAAARYEPSDVIPLYREHVERLIDSRNPRLYECAAGQLRRLRMLYRRAGASREFTRYLTELLGRHRRKTRLLDEIRKARIALPKAVAG